MGKNKEKWGTEAEERARSAPGRYQTSRKNMAHPSVFFDRIFPHIFPHLDSKSVRICTHVCKTWRRVIFTFAETHPFRCPFNNETEMDAEAKNTLEYLQNPFALESFEVSFGSLESITKFLKIGPNLMNPFIGRSVSLSCYISEDEKEDLSHFTNSARTLLEQYGKYIWHFKISSHHQLESGPDFFSRLKLSLSLVQNLRSLHVLTAQDPYSASQNFSELPPLEHLESLTLDTMKETGGGISVALLKSYMMTPRNTLRFLSWRLECCKRPLEQCICQNLEDIDFSGITHVRFVSFQDVDPNHIQKILSVFPKDGQLQKVESVGGSWAEDGIFQHLNGFENLFVLEVERSPYQLGKYYCNGECKCSGAKCTSWPLINLPKLHTLRIKCQDIGDSYKFLEDVPSLENFHVEFHLGYSKYSLAGAISNEREASKQKIKRFGCHYDQITEELNKWIYKESEKEMDSMLLWNLLPGLQTLFICYVYGYVSGDDDDDGGNYPEISTIIHTYQRKDFVST